MSQTSHVIQFRPQAVWKVASRWSADGNSGSSILESFRRHNVVFAGTKQHLFRQINEGDLVAVSDGKKVVALGIVNSPVTPLPALNINFSAEELKQVGPDESVLAVRLSFTDLDESDYVNYRIGAVHGVHDRAEQFIELYFEYRQRYEQEQSFEINAKSCTLLINESKSNEVLWKDGCLFQVPVYQRPYSWGEQEIRRLLSDLLTAFFGRLGRVRREPMFIGTMQLSAPDKLDETGAVVQKIIDGQQRLTTLILILKALQMRDPESTVWQSIRYRERLKTLVNGGIQQEYLKQALNENNACVALNALNSYQKSLEFIIEEIAEVEKENEGEPFIEEFVRYLVSKVYFVVIETRACLSKTLQIFDAINTSGMDLNGGDVFKVRFYEYLKEVHKKDDTVFDEICSLYERIDAGNERLGRKTVYIENVLSLAQQIVITESGMANDPRFLAGTTFFDRYFDTVLNINQWDGFSKDACAKVNLTIDKLNSLIDLLFSWENHVNNSLSLEAAAMDRFIGWTRYGRYYQVIHMFRYRFNPSNQDLEAFIVSYSKLLIIYSVLFQKVTKDGRNNIFDVMKLILSPEKRVSNLEVMQYIDKCRHEQRKQLRSVLNEFSIAHIPTAKNLLCRLSAMRDETECSHLDSKALCSLLFETSIDIEHIESANHEDSKQREIVHAKWGDELHRLGNLIVLEYDVNRSISNSDYAEVKRPRYEKSTFVSVKRFAKDNEQWSLDRCLVRKMRLVKELSTYLCKPGADH